MSSTPFAEGGIRGFLHRPTGGAERGLVLTHGAGGNCRAPLLVAAAEGFSAAGLAVLRCDLPFRQRRSSGPTAPACKRRSPRCVASCRDGSFSAANPMGSGRPLAPLL